MPSGISFVAGWLVFIIHYSYLFLVITQKITWFLGNFIIVLEWEYHLFRVVYRVGRLGSTE